MKITIITLIALGLTTCCLMLFCTSEQRKQHNTQWFEVNNNQVCVVVIDSCEYLSMRPGADFGLLTHKGNCNNPFHLKNK